MTLRPEVIRERLHKLRTVLRNLATMSGVPQETFVADFRHQWMAERGLQLAAEAIFDIGNHVLAGDLNVSATSYEDVLIKLGERQVVSQALVAKLRGLGGFRNVLVHAYLDVDVARVHEYLTTRLDHFIAFTEEIECYLEERSARGT